MISHTPFLVADLSLAGMVYAIATQPTANTNVLALASTRRGRESKIIYISANWGIYIAGGYHCDMQLYTRESIDVNERVKNKGKTKE